jgi:uncharacterized protein with HEPN domain
MSALQPDDYLYLRHILDAASSIQAYLQAINEDGFSTNRLVQDAVIRNLEVIGEAAKRLSADCKAAAPDVPWRSVTGMRDKLIHDYMGTDVAAVWKTTQSDLPLLKTAIETLLA